MAAECFFVFTVVMLVSEQTHISAMLVLVSLFWDLGPLLLATFRCRDIMYIISPLQTGNAVTFGSILQLNTYDT